MGSPFCRTPVVALIVALVLAPMMPVHADEAEDQYTVAAGYYDRGQWKLAIEEFQVFLKKFPGSPHAEESLFRLGESLLQVGKLDDARVQFRQYVSRAPQGKFARPAMFRLGEAAYLAGRFDAAKPDLEGFLAKYPGDPLGAYVLPYLGDIALAKSDPAAAAAYYRQCLKQYPEGKLQDDCRVNLGRALEKLGQAEEAERLYLAVASKPNSPQVDAAQFQLGALQYAAGRYDQAIESLLPFEMRLTGSAWQPNARMGLGLALLKLNKPTEATKHFDAVLANKSSGDELFQQAGRGKVQAALQAKDYAAVDREIAQFENRFPKSSVMGDVRRMFARSLVERKEFQRAETLLQSLARGAPAGQADLESRYLLAASYEGLKRYDAALAAVLPVVDAATGQLKADALLTQGSLLLALKKYADAIGPLEALLLSKPTGDAGAKALGTLAICYARTSQIDKAKKAYADLLAKYPKHPLLAPTTEFLAEAAYEANDAAWSAELSGRLSGAASSPEYEQKGKIGLGWSQFKAGKPAEAAAVFDDVLKHNPPPAVVAEIALVRGRILEQLGQNEAAMAMYRLVIDQQPNSAQYADALLSAARLHDKLKQKQEAASLYERLTKEFPQLPKLDAVLYEWAWVLTDLGKPEAAAEAFARLRKECPQSRFAADAACRLAQQAFDAKNYDVAAKFIEEVLAGKSEPAVREYALYLRGQLGTAKNDWPKARESFESLLQEFPQTNRRSIVEFWIAEAYYREAKYAEADARFAKLADAIKGKRESWTAMIPLRRAQALAKQNQWTEAQAIATKIAADFPNFEQQYEVDYLLGRCLANAADYEGARRAYQKVIHSAAGEKTETAAMAQWMIGESYFHQKNYPAAVKEYSKLEFLYAFPTWQAGALFEAGRCHELLGENKDAAACYQRIVRNYATTTFADQARQRLAAEKQ